MNSTIIPTLRKTPYVQLPAKRYVKLKKPFVTSRAECLVVGQILETSNGGAGERVLELISPMGERMAWATSEVWFPENHGRQEAFACAALDSALQPISRYTRADLTDEERRRVGATVIEHVGRFGRTVWDLKIGELIEILAKTDLI